jgi:hypothetical protein
VIEAPVTQRSSADRWWRRIDWRALAIGAPLTHAMGLGLSFGLVSLVGPPSLSGLSGRYESAYSAALFGGLVSGLFLGAAATGFLSRPGKSVGSAVADGLLVSIVWTLWNPLALLFALPLSFIAGHFGAKLRERFDKSRRKDARSAP